MVEAIQRGPKSIFERTLYVPQMHYACSRLVAAAYRSVGIDATVSPDSDERTLELGGRYTSGEECLPEKVTLGNFLRVLMDEGKDPGDTAFLMMTSAGPCRFGQYRSLIRKVLDDLGYEDAIVVSPSSDDGYAGIGENASKVFRRGWRGALIGDMLMKALLRTRPYELRAGDSDEVFLRSLRRMCDLVAQPDGTDGEQMEQLVDGLETCRLEFESVPADYSEPRLLVGIVGEIFCRLNDFSNASLIRKLEEHGCEAWLSDVGEWVWYLNNNELHDLQRIGKGRWHPAQWKARIKKHFQHGDEKRLHSAFGDYFAGYEEPDDVQDVLDLAEPYMPRDGSRGEMVLSTGRTRFMHAVGADGIADISPFTCMNGIITEAVYTQLSRDHDGIPIRVFYFDGLATDLDSDVGIFVELIKTYSRRKTRQRYWPHGAPAPRAETGVERQQPAYIG